jgi:ABC-2 type transport system permease protein
MNKNLFKGVLSQNLKGFIIWTSIVFAITSLAMAFYPTISEAGDEIAKLLETMPKGLLKGMGMDESMMSTSLGFYKIYYGVYLVVIMGIYLFSTGAGLFAKEETNKTIEFIMSKPLSRNSYFASKVYALLGLYLAMVIIQAGFAFLAITVAAPGSFEISSFITLHVHGAFLLLIFLSLGIFMAMLVHPQTNFMGVGVGIVFGSYFLNALSQGSPDLEWIGYFSLFYYADFEVMRPDYSINLIVVLIFVAISVLLTLYGSVLFKKRDFKGI